MVERKTFPYTCSLQAYRKGRNWGQHRYHNSVSQESPALTLVHDIPPSQRASDERKLHFQPSTNTFSSHSFFSPVHLALNSFTLLSVQKPFSIYLSLIISRKHAVLPIPSFWSASSSQNALQSKHSLCENAARGQVKGINYKST